MSLPKSSIIPISLVLLITSFAGVRCSKKPEALPPPAKVSVVRAIQTDVPIYEEFVAQTFGQADVDIRSRVEGWVMSVHFKEGSAIKKGALLYIIDDAQYQTRVDRAASDLAAAQTELVRAQNELNRVQPLVELNALSRKDLDNAIAASEAAQAQVRAAEAGLSNARIEYGYTRVYAPFDGIVGISNVRVGDYVSRMGTSSVLTTISSIGSMRVRFQISEREYLRVAKLSRETLNKTRQHIQLILADNTVYPQEGEVNFANREIDPKTGTLTIEALFPNPDGLLRPGLFVKVRALLDTYPDAVVIPQRAVMQLQNISQVFTVSDSNTLKTSVVETGPKTVKDGSSAAGSKQATGWPW
jgi:membrane fusion protein, multidrug efflux system